MKRTIALLLSLLLALGCISSGLAAPYGLQEKMAKQIDAGSGVKGSFTLDVQGTGALATLLSAFAADLALQVNYISMNSAFQLQLDLTRNEQNMSTTLVFGDGAVIGVKSDLLPETALGISATEDLASQWRTADAERNVSWYSAALQILNMSDATWTANLEAALLPYLTKVELWLQAYGSAPTVSQGDTGKFMTIQYQIPVAAVKAELKQLLMDALKDEALRAPLAQCLSESQMALYFNPHLQDYYFKAVDDLLLYGEIVMDRELSTKGEVLKTDMVLPVADDIYGFETVQITQTPTDTVVWASGRRGEIELTLNTMAASEKDTHYQGKLRFLPPEQDDAAAYTVDEGAEEAAASGWKPVSLTFDCLKTENNWTGADDKLNESTVWTVALEENFSHLSDLEEAALAAEKEKYFRLPATKLELNTQFISGQARNNSTTMQLSLTLNQGEDQAALAGAVKTAIPWTMQEMDTEQLTMYGDLTDVQRQGYWDTLKANLLRLGTALALNAATATPAAAE